MVTQLGKSSLVFFIWSLHGHALDFSMEPSKKDFYQGENISVSFVISAKLDSVDVEVAKFPEFRSFWSENTVLRQGPIPLLPPGGFFDPTFPINPQIPFQELARRFRARNNGLERKGVVGSYTLTPMVGREDLKIEPMKIVVKDPFSGSKNVQSFESKMPDLIIRRLPSPPAELAEIFKGAVGELRLETESPEIRYRPGEAGVLRLILQGEGNYPEINEIPLALPRGIVVLSSRSQMLQTGQESSKVFEYTLSIELKDAQEVGPFSILFFNPRTNRYLKGVTSKVRLSLAEPVVLSPQAPDTIEIPLEPKWHPSGAWILSPISFRIQALLMLFLSLHMIWIHFEKLKRKKHIGLSYIRHQKLKAIQQSIKTGDSERARSELTLLIDELLENDLSTGLFLSRSQKLAGIEKRYGLEARKQLEKYLSEHDHSRYSKEKPPMASLEIHLQKLASTLDLLCG